VLEAPGPPDHGGMDSMATTDCNTTVNPREQKGLRIAERHRLRPKGHLWLVPSDSSQTK